MNKAPEDVLNAAMAALSVQEAKKAVYTDDDDADDAYEGGDESSEHENSDTETDADPTLDTVAQRLDGLVNHALAMVADVLRNRLSDFHLTGDSNHGVTEASVQLMFATAIRSAVMLMPNLGSTMDEQPQLTLEHSVYQPGGKTGRIDALVRLGHCATLIELKYVRCGFIKGVSYTKNEFEMARRCRVYASASLDPDTVTDANLKKLVFQAMENGKFYNRKVNYLWKQALSQVRRYANGLRLNKLGHLPSSVTRLRGIAVVGVGTRLICSPSYTEEELTNNKDEHDQLIVPDV